MAHNGVVNQGMTQVLTGLGILLGAGRITNATHEKILALINEGQEPSAEAENINAKEISQDFPRPGKETPISINSHDLLGLGSELAEVSITDRGPRGPRKSAFDVSSASISTKSGGQAKVICPWWSTNGYSCREHEKGRCPMYHEDIPDGLRDPLICHFWADGGRCTKTESTCRFAHYPAQHRIIAPLPAKKKTKKYRGDHGEPYDAGRFSPIHHGNEDGSWRPQSRSQHYDNW